MYTNERRMEDLEWQIRRDIRKALDSVTGLTLNAGRMITEAEMHEHVAQTFWDAAIKIEKARDEYLSLRLN